MQKCPSAGGHGEPESGAEDEYHPDAERVGQRAGEHETDHLREECHRHVRARDAADQRVLRLALKECLRRHHDGGEGKADRERRGHGRGAARHGAEHQRAGADPGESREHEHVLGHAGGDLANDLRPREQTDADRGADEPEQPRARVECVAHVDRDERAETVLFSPAAIATTTNSTAG